jgi:hypothetical protein
LVRVQSSLPTKVEVRFTPDFQNCSKRLGAKGK